MTGSDQSGHPAPVQAPTLGRSDLYAGRLRGGELAPGGRWARAWWALRPRLATRARRDEQALDRCLIGTAAELSCPNVIAFCSPKGGVGKTTCTLLVGDTLAAYPRLHCIAVDANPDYGTLGSLAAEGSRSAHSLSELLDAAEDVRSPAQMRRFVSVLKSGLHLLAAPESAHQMAALSDEHYARLIDLLAGVYEVILLDLGTGLTDRLATLALARADQVVVVCTPEWVTARRVLGALRDLDTADLRRGLSVCINQAPARDDGERPLLQAALRRAGIERQVIVPEDPRLRELLDSGAYRLAALPRTTRLAVKRLGLSVGEGLQ